MMERPQPLISLMRVQARSRFKGGVTNIGLPKAVNGQELSSFSGHSKLNCVSDSGVQ